VKSFNDTEMCDLEIERRIPPRRNESRLHQADLQQIDWDWILRVLTIVRGRAQSGTPLHVRRGSLPPTADVKYTARAAVDTMLNDIFATAVVDEPE
jgi:hypothetical protein